MKIFKGILSLLWRLWFALTFAVPFLALLPITLFMTLSPKYYPALYFFLHRQSKFMMYASGIFPEVKKDYKLNPKKQYLFCSNHTSTLDIPMMFFLSKKPISFIGKESLSKYPIFGYYYKRFNVLINRKSLRNSYQAFEEAGQRIKEGQNMVIFPEGGIPISSERLAKFKNGPFRLAVEQDVSIIPITFADNKRIFPIQYLKGKPQQARVTIHQPIENCSSYSVEELKNKVFNIIEKELIRYEN
jgi:1-acyl-sn-glycerol-3-phosphate acyltransferase